ncbi:uncharacterized protein LOC143304857 [Bombus vancouverensis nearcticus]|uniref:uncharacterized protein LOC143304857 n=1 Tax=Bombus vancouverensis nearcticus TaxID=2705178 RepID=UPI00402BB77F
MAELQEQTCKVCAIFNVGCMLQSPMEFREIVVTLRWLPLQSYPTRPCVILMRVDSKSIWFREWRTGALQFYEIQNALWIPRETSGQHLHVLPSVVQRMVDEFAISSIHTYKNS